jgi:acetoin utilization protein AcuC
MADFELAADHPFKPVRLELTRTLLQATGLLTPAQVVAPTPVSDEDLLNVHERRYVQAVMAASRGEEVEGAVAYGLGSSDNPIFPGMHQAVLGLVAATVTAVDLVASGAARTAANFGGGLHHGLAARASGFCLYNDLAVAIRQAVDRHGVRVAYVDLDAHHGDGVQWLFYESPEVLTVSLHESGRYLFPGTGHTYETGKGAGRGGAVNVPLEPYTEDDSFLQAFELVVPRALRHFQPDLLVLQAGADMHHHDPLADMSLTLTGMAASYRRVVELATELTGGRLVVTGGGGYDPYRTVPRAWAHAWAAMTGRQLPDQLPEQWRAGWHQQLGRDAEQLPSRSLDGPADFAPAPRRQAISSRNRLVAERAITTLEELWRAT